MNKTRKLIEDRRQIVIEAKDKSRLHLKTETLNLLYTFDKVAVFVLYLIALIEAVVAGVLWKDGTITAGWSNLDVSNLARLILVLDEAQRRRTLPETDL